jgi:hypothetical protein
MSRARDAARRVQASWVERQLSLDGRAKSLHAFRVQTVFEAAGAQQGLLRLA